MVHDAPCLARKVLPSSLRLPESETNLAVADFSAGYDSAAATPEKRKGTASKETRSFFIWMLLCPKILFLKFSAISGRSNAKESTQSIENAHGSTPLCERLTGVREPTGAQKRSSRVSGGAHSAVRGDCAGLVLKTMSRRARPPFRSRSR